MIGLSTTAYPGVSFWKEFDAWLETVESLGFRVVEVVSEWPHYLDGKNLPALRDLLSSYKLVVTVHAPFSDLNIASFNERIRKASLEIIRETLRLSSALGAAVVTVHPGHCSPLSRRYQLKYIEIHREALKLMEKWSNEYGIPVGVENMPRFPILDSQTCERLAEIVEGIEIGITFDVGHLNTTTGNFGRFLQILGDRIVHVHLHDNHGSRDEHLALGEGTVPWEDVLPRLPDVTKVLEVTDLESARKSLGFLKDLH